MAGTRERAEMRCDMWWAEWHLAWSPLTIVIVVFVQLLSCVQLFVTPMDCSTPGFPVLHYLLEFAQTRVHRVGDAIQPSHPVSPTSPPALNLSQHQHLFQWVSSASGGQNIGASASILPMNSQGWSPLGLTSLISMLSKGLYPRFSRGI